jgi:hypothetical protein
MTGEIGAGSFTQEDIPSSIEDHDIAEAILFEIFGKEVADRTFRGP